MTGQARPAPGDGGTKRAEFPSELIPFLPPGTVHTWLSVAPLIPPSVYLAGGTGLAVHLGHRVSRHLDFMFDGDVDIDDLERRLDGVGKLAVTFKDDLTLNAVLDATTIQFLGAHGQHRLRDTTDVAGIAVASVEDITATKLKVVLDRGELRDYYDLMEIDRRRIPIEEGIDLFLRRYGIGRDDQRIAMLLRSLGHLDDVADDPGLPVDRTTVEQFWHRRAADIARSFDRF